MNATLGNFPAMAKAAAARIAHAQVVDFPNSGHSPQIQEPEAFYKALLTGLAAAVLLSWLAYIPRRLGDRLFSWNDTEAYWRGWQITKVHGGLGRRYRDLRFDALTACPQCQGGGSSARDTPCLPCLGTGRVSAEGVS